MSAADIIRNNIIFGNCYTGKDFENTTVDLLQKVGFNAKRVGGPNDGGIDVVANMNILGVEYSYYIQCKYYNHSCYSLHYAIGYCKIISNYTRDCAI